uniref:Cation-transporting P-type ATPase C-terminal domain-containing protein n=1 Tax=Dendroctonus ponderosae TaxID=77166 RepID=A0AAR5QDK6_DENPD
MNSVLPCVGAKFFEPVSNISGLNVQSKFVQGMATCHSLTTIDGKMNGDPLDLNMFEFTKWTLEEPGANENTRFDILAPTIVTPKKEQVLAQLDHPDSEIFADQSSYQIGIIREFSFSSTAQCMSVICKDLKKPNMFAFTKGAPEKLYNFCIPETIPTDFQNRLSFYTTRGFRVIALAYKELPVKFKWTDAQAAERDMIEHDLEFLGLLILQNPLKSETVPVLRQFRNANIRTVMITGDNIRTAISVARDCEMVDSTATIYILNVTEVNNINEKPNIVMEKADSGVQPDFTAIHIYDTNSYFAIDGKTWTNLKLYYEDLISSLLVRTTVFARFQPDQKTQLVTSFQDLDYIVSMVGDGANDCGALKAAHVGVSLSPAEASVAAPFTSGIPDISCIIWLILEGRCSLVTSFSIFKYMALYSMIQFVTILIIYTCHSMLGNFQFLFIDLIITTTLAVTMGRQGPSKILHSKRPMSSLVSAKNLVPLTLQIFAIAAFQVGALYYLYQQDWFQPIPSDVSDEIILSWENTVLFTVSCFQYVILAWHFTKGKPYRMNVFTNFWFLLNVLCLMVIVTWMALYPCKRIAEIMELIDFAEGGFHHKNFRCLLLLFPIGQFIVAGAIETFMHERTWLKRLFQCIFCKKQPKNKYKRLLQNQNFEDYLASLRELSNSLR